MNILEEMTLQNVQAQPASRYLVSLEEVCDCLTKELKNVSYLEFDDERGETDVGFEGGIFHLNTLALERSRRGGSHGPV